MEKTCVCCKRKFVPNPRLCNQQYCSRSECQRARKRKWQREKLAKDSAYRDNQAAAQREWCSRNKGYWRDYRRRNPVYTERNRIGQRERNRLRRSGPEIAKMDALIVEIDVVSRGCSMGVQGP